MRRILLATAAATAMLAGASAASAQNFQGDGPDYYNYRGYHQRGPFVERGVGLQIGPLGAGIYDSGPAYYDGYAYPRRAPADNSTENMRVFRSQEVWPQSPPGGS